MSNIDSLRLVRDNAVKIEELLTNLGGTGKGLGEKYRSLQLPEDLDRKLRQINYLRNRVIHDGYELDDRELERYSELAKSCIYSLESITKIAIRNNTFAPSETKISQNNPIEIKGPSSYTPISTKPRTEKGDKEGQSVAYNPESANAKEDEVKSENNLSGTNDSSYTPTATQANVQKEHPQTQATPHNTQSEETKEGKTEFNNKPINKRVKNFVSTIYGTAAAIDLFLVIIFMPFTNVVIDSGIHGISRILSIIFMSLVMFCTYYLVILILVLIFRFLKSIIMK